MKPLLPLFSKKYVQLFWEQVELSPFSKFPVFYFDLDLDIWAIWWSFPGYRAIENGLQFFFRSKFITTFHYKNGSLNNLQIWLKINVFNLFVPEIKSSCSILTLNFIIIFFTTTWTHIHSLQWKFSTDFLNTTKAYF